MSTTVTDGFETVTPTLWVDSRRGYASQNRVHQLLSGRVAVTLAPTSPGSGTLGFLFKGATEMEACVRLHRTGALFQISDPMLPGLAMTYVLAQGGRVEVEQLTEHDDLWMVRIDYQEVTE